LSALSLNLASCGQVNDQPELGQVTGTVTMDGKPIAGVAVVFYPDSGRPARALTDAEGKYDLVYIRDAHGTKLGHNRVEIATNEEEDDESADAQSDEDSPTPKSGKPRIPARYNTKSELEADVKPGENVFDFELESKPAATVMPGS
jgi:hypothetical protein